MIALLTSFCYEHATFGLDMLLSVYQFLSAFINKGKLFNDNTERDRYH